MLAAARRLPMSEDGLLVRAASLRLVARTRTWAELAAYVPAPVDSDVLLAELEAGR